ncbi:MAG: hypothetical protein AB8B78_14000 [Polaribacter sp.]
MHPGKIKEDRIKGMEIENNIENLYKVFAKYNILGNLRDRSCDCCITNADIKSLLSKKLKDLSEDDLGHFLRSAITTFGDENDYKHFLPRIFELLNSNDNLIDDFLTFEKLNYTDWKSWNQLEIKAIENYFFALWIDALNNDSDNQYFENVLILVLEYINPNDVFKEWEKYFTENRVKIILNYVLRGFTFNIQKDKDDAFNNWLSSKAVLELLEKIYDKVDDEFMAKEISIAYTILEKRK